jgi:hypothetical protein
MQIEFKITGEDQNELMPYFQAQNRDASLGIGKIQMD